MVPKDILASAVVTEGPARLRQIPKGVVAASLPDLSCIVFERVRGGKLQPQPFFRMLGGSSSLERR